MSWMSEHPLKPVHTRRVLFVQYYESKGLLKLREIKFITRITSPLLTVEQSGLSNTMGVRFIYIYILKY